MKIGRAQYARFYGPTTGDMFRLGDTSLLAEVEFDHARPGDELTTGAGKVMRDGEGYRTRGTDASGALDLVVQNAVIIDPVLGIVKGDIGVRRGRIVDVGKAGNPDIMDGVTPNLVTGPNTTVIHGDQMVVTPGVIEAHAHFFERERRLVQAFRGAERTDAELTDRRVELDRTILRRTLRAAMVRTRD